MGWRRRNSIPADAILVAKRRRRLSADPVLQFPGWIGEAREHPVGAQHRVYVRRRAREVALKRETALVIHEGRGLGSLDTHVAASRAKPNSEMPRGLGLGNRVARPLPIFGG